MRKRTNETGMKRILIVLAAAVAITLGVIGVKAEGKNNGAEQLFKAKCAVCHSDAIALNMRKDRKEWEETIKRMQQKRPNFISDQDAQKIVDFLVSQSASKKK
jgi:cytochrome c5